jgi:hypothetical protein
MATSLDLRPLTAPIRIAVTSAAPIVLRLSTGPISIRVLGLPGPAGLSGPERCSHRTNSHDRD